MYWQHADSRYLTGKAVMTVHDIRDRQILMAASAAFIITAAVFSPVAAKAANGSIVYTNPDTGYDIYFDDDADLLSSEEEQKLLDDMKPITQYTNVGFDSTDSNDFGDAAAYAKDYYEKTIGYDNDGTVFVVDMDTRHLQIHSEGAAWSIIGKGYANTITDNVYQYASDGDYYKCASKAYSQIYALLSGGKILQPMRYISAAVLALIIAFMINYIVVMVYSHKKKARDNELLRGMVSHCDISNAGSVFTHQTKEYSPRESSSSGGGSSGGGCGGGGGGGGGGGHSF